MSTMKKMTVTQWCKRGLTEPSVNLLLRRVRLIWSPTACPHVFMWMVMILMMLVVAALFSTDF